MILKWTRQPIIILFILFQQLRITFAVTPGSLLSSLWYSFYFFKSLLLKTFSMHKLWPCYSVVFSRSDQTYSAPCVPQYQTPFPTPSSFPRLFSQPHATYPCPGQTLHTRASSIFLPQDWISFISSHWCRPSNPFLSQLAAPTGQVKLLTHVWLQNTNASTLTIQICSTN